MLIFIGSDPPRVKLGFFLSEPPLYQMNQSMVKHCMSGGPDCCGGALGILSLICILDPCAFRDDPNDSFPVVDADVNYSCHHLVE